MRQQEGKWYAMHMHIEHSKSREINGNEERMQNESSGPGQSQINQEEIS